MEMENDDNDDDNLKIYYFIEQRISNRHTHFIYQFSIEWYHAAGVNA